jgi:hypothetical protein
MSTAMPHLYADYLAEISRQVRAGETDPVGAAVTVLARRHDMSELAVHDCLDVAFAAMGEERVHELTRAALNAAVA